jgi:hypothetical protein
MLAKRLARHGLAVSGGALATVVTQGAASASAPAPLVTATIEAASSVVAGNVLSAGLISATVIALTQGVVQTMLVNKIKKVLVVLVVALAVGGIGFGLRDSQAPAQSASPASDQKAQARGEPVASDDTPDGNPEKLRAELDALAKKIARAQHDWLEAKAEIVKLERRYLFIEAHLRQLTGTAPARTIDIGEVQPVQKTVTATTTTVGEGAKPAPRTDLEQRNKLLEKKLQEMDRRIKELEKRLENQKQ